MPWRIRAPATAFLLTPKASAMRDIGMPSAESSRSRGIAGSYQGMCQEGEFVGQRGASFGHPSVLRGCPLLTQRHFQLWPPRFPCSRDSPRTGKEVDQFIVRFGTYDFKRPMTDRLRFGSDNGSAKCHRSRYPVTHNASHCAFLGIQNSSALLKNHRLPRESGMYVMPEVRK